MKRKISFVVFLLALIQTGFAGTIYWVGTTGNYSDPANWNTQSNGSGTSGVPINTDDIVIDRNATITIDGAYQPSSLWIINNAVVNFTNSVASRTYSIGGSLTVSPQFKVEAGATLNIQGTASILLEVISGSLAQIYGTIDITGTSSRMNYLGGITQVMDGGKLRYGPGSSNGTGSRATLFMLYGSTYEVYKNGGTFPTGTYDDGSLVLNTGAVANPALFAMNSSVGSYGKYEFNCPGYTSTTNAINQNVTVYDFTLTNCGTGIWVFSTSSASAYTLTVNGTFYMEAGTTLDLNRTGVATTLPTTILAYANFYSFGIIEETGNSSGCIIELAGNLPANLGIMPSTLSGNVSLRMNRTVDVLASAFYMPSSSNARLYLDNGNIDVLTNNGVVKIQNPAPDAIVGGSLNSHIIGRLLRESTQFVPYEFPVSNNAAQFAKVVITPNNSNPTLWDVEFKTPNPNASSGLTPGVLDMIAPYYWRIDAIGSPAAGASNLTLHYGELTSSTVLIPSQLKMARWNGTSWVNYGGLESGGTLTNTLGSTGGPASSDDITGFSTTSFFTLGGILGTLPVSIEYFTGVKNGRNHQLGWKVNCTNSQSLTMTLERSSDSRNFRSIQTISADAVRCREAFNHTDFEPLEGLNYYRLRVTDSDGKTTYSRIVGLLNRKAGFEVVSVAPNPIHVGEEVVITVSTVTKGAITVVLTDMHGRRIMTQSFQAIAGNNQLKLDASNLPPGGYHAIILAEGGERISQQLIKL